MFKVKSKVQRYQKLGHLWQVFYGMPGFGAYGYSCTLKYATMKAKQRYLMMIKK